MTGKRRRAADAEPQPEQAVARFYARTEADRRFYQRHQATGGFAKWRGNRPRP